MIWQRQILAVVLSLMGLTPFGVQARLSDPVLPPGEPARVESALRANLSVQTQRLLSYVPAVKITDVRFNFEWSPNPDFVTDLQAGEVLILVPRAFATVAALNADRGARARLNAAFTHQIGHLIFAAAGGGGDPALAELFADVLTVVDANDPGAVTRAFAVDGRVPTVESAHGRAFDPRPRALTPREWSAPAYRLNTVKAEFARRAEWAPLDHRPRERAAYLRHVLDALVRTARADYGPATAASSARLNQDVTRALWSR